VYHDFWFKIVGSLVASEIIDTLGREESFFYRFTTSYFYMDLLGGFVIALLLWETVRFATRYLDKKYDWMEKSVQRILLQTILGVIVPALLSFFLTFAYMKFAYNQDIFKTSWLYNEYYAVILIILLINIIYFTWWLYLKWKKQPGHTSSLQQPLQSNKQLSKASAFSRNTHSNTIEVTKAGKTILLSSHEIAIAYLHDGYCYIKTFGEDVFLTTYPLDEISRMLNENWFFRVNRQVLISRKSCSAYKSIEHGKVELDLHPPIKNPVIVSQKRAKEFRKWISAVVQVQN
jgi:DNA-binding LytR/AlgR family response regulator